MNTIKFVESRKLLGAVVALACSAPGFSAFAAPPSWQLPVYIDQGQGSNYSPRVAVSGSGNATAVWADGQGVWANDYVFGAGWSDPTHILSPPEAQAPAWDVAMNGDVQATVAMRGAGPTQRMTVRRHGPAGWTPSIRLDQVGLTSKLSNPAVAMGPNETAVVVWATSVGPGLYASRFKNGSWVPVVVLAELESFDQHSEPAVAMDVFGNAIAVWSHDITATDFTQVRVSRYSAATNSWSAPKTLQTCEDAQLPTVAVDASGGAMAVWQCRAAANQIWAAHYSVAGDWELPTRIDANISPDPDAPRTPLAVGSTGAAAITWIHDQHVYASRYVAGQGWSTAPTHIGFDEGGAFTPDVAIDSNGDITVAWAQQESFPDISDRRVVARRYERGEGWGTIDALEFSNFSSWDPKVGVDAQGRVVATWRLQEAVDSRIRAAIYE